MQIRPEIIFTPSEVVTDFRKDFPTTFVMVVNTGPKLANWIKLSRDNLWLWLLHQSVLTVPWCNRYRIWRGGVLSSYLAHGWCLLSGEWCWWQECCGEAHSSWWCRAGHQAGSSWWCLHHSRLQSLGLHLKYIDLNREVTLSWAIKIFIRPGGENQINDYLASYNYFSSVKPASQRL